MILEGYTQNFYREDWREIGGGVGLFLSSSSGEEIFQNNTFQDLLISLYFDNSSYQKEKDLDNTYFYLNNFESKENYLSKNLFPTLPRFHSSDLKVGNYWKNFSGVDVSPKDYIIDEPFFLTSTLSDQYPLYFPNYVPTIDSELSHSWFIENGVNQTIHWLIPDDDTQNYSVSRNGTYIGSGALNGTKILNTTILNITGIYEYSCFVIDLWNNTKIISVEIEVEPADFDKPILYAPHNITLHEAEPKRTFTWNSTEVHPEFYTLTLSPNNGSYTSYEISKGEWTKSNLTIELGNLYERPVPPFFYTLNISMYDVLGQSNFSLVEIYIIDNGPVIFGDEEINGSQDSLVDIFWDIYDNEITNSSMWFPEIPQVFRNGTIMPNENTEIVGYYLRYDFFGKVVGMRVRHRFNTTSSEIQLKVYNFTIQVNDTEIPPYSNTSTTIVQIYDRIPPFISPDPNNPTQFDEFDGVQVFNWNCSDTNPVAYNMSRYSFENEYSVIVFSDHDGDHNNTWSGQNLTYYLDPFVFDIGDYRFMVDVTDIGNNTSTAPGGIFSILDTTPPNRSNNLPLNLTGDRALEYVEIDEVILKWNFTDRNPQNYRLFRNNTLIATEEWNGSLIEITNLSEIL